MNYGKILSLSAKSTILFSKGWEMSNKAAKVRKAKTQRLTSFTEVCYFLLRKDMFDWNLSEKIIKTNTQHSFGPTHMFIFVHKSSDGLLLLFSFLFLHSLQPFGIDLLFCFRDDLQKFLLSTVPLDLRSLPLVNLLSISFQFFLGASYFLIQLLLSRLLLP